MRARMAAESAKAARADEKEEAEAAATSASAVESPSPRRLLQPSDRSQAKRPSAAATARAARPAAKRVAAGGGSRNAAAAAARESAPPPFATASSADGAAVGRTAAVASASATNTGDADDTADASSPGAPGAAASAAARACRGGCGFFASPQFEGYCSKCYRVHVLGEAPAAATASPGRASAARARQAVARHLGVADEAMDTDEDVPTGLASAAHDTTSRALSPASSTDSETEYIPTASADAAMVDAEDEADDAQLDAEDDEEDGVVSSAAPAARSHISGRANTAVSSAEAGDDENDDVSEGDVVADSVTQGKRRLRVVMRDDGDPHAYLRRLERWRVFLAQLTGNPRVSDMGELALEVALDRENPDELDEWFDDDDFSLPPVAIPPGILMPGFLAHRYVAAL